ncbi:MAG: hypothetical protein RJB22_2215, partial [Pseudomonadota bacterium]
MNTRRMRRTTASHLNPAEAARGPEPRFFNRELSWLQFNWRVLEEAHNPAHPVLERLRFLSISGSNLDEFFMVRVAGLRGQMLQGIDQRSIDGLTASQQMAAIETEAAALMRAQQMLWRDLRTELAQSDIFVLDEAELDDATRDGLRRHFTDQIFPVLTPQALDPAHPFPFIPNQGLTLIFDLQR